MQSKMRAAAYFECGEPEAIQISEVPRPKPGPSQALIRVKACALNYLDLWNLWGPADDKVKFPFWGGADIAGEIIEIEAESLHLAEVNIGDRVLVNPSLYCGKCEYCIAGEQSMCVEYRILGADIPGGLAEYVAVNIDSLMRFPDHLSFEQAAAVPLVFQTAWRALIDQAKVKAGEDIVILGASGGVATAAIQIAWLAGGRIFAVTSSAEKVSKALALGADFAFDRNKEDYWQQIRRLTSDRGVDVVVENVGAKTWGHSLEALANGGRLVTYGRTTGRMAETNISKVFWNQLHIIGSTMANRREFIEVMHLIFQGRLQPVIDSVYPFEKTADAYTRLARGEQFGKIVINVSD
jgi:NADPH:quinone reductase-like Zn-dependent oxidoreductase